MNELSSIKEIDVFSDGGAEPNPGKGGFGVIMKYKNRAKEFSQGYVLTTNNRMELMGVIFALEQLKEKCIVNVYTDSKYVVEAIEKGWARKWQENNWFRTKSEKAINCDLWERLLNLIDSNERVNFHWIKGHAGHIENERCDQLANIALNSENLLEDINYNPNHKVTIKKEGDECRKCNIPVIKKNSTKRNFKPNQSYYYEYCLVCPNCKTLYLVEEAKVIIKSNSNSLF